MKFRLILPLVAFALVSCKDELQVQEQTVDLNSVTPTKYVSNQPATESPADWAEQARQANSPTPSPATATPATAPGMNPPHGQPGHRCDIAVGAPLNSAAAKQSPQSGQSISINTNGQVSGGENSNVKITRTDNTTNQSTTTTVPANTAINSGAVKPGTNPPHGQPGHRCELAVGAPLN